jgi:serine/threonine-protein kinase
VLFRSGTVYVGSDDHEVYALDAVTGRVRWTHATGGFVESSPVVAGGTVYVGSDDHRVYALNAATG